MTGDRLYLDHILSEHLPDLKKVAERMMQDIEQQENAGGTDEKQAEKT